LIFPIFLWFCLLSSSVYRIPWRIFCSGGLVVIYCFSFYLLRKIFIAPSIWNDSFSGWSIVRLNLFSFNTRILHSRPFFLLRFLLRNLLWFCWVYLSMMFFLFYSLQ
jgi:hypothetical protein